MTILLDEEYFESIGLAALPPESKRSLANAIEAELGLRAGWALADGMSDEQLEEFGRISEKDEATVRKVLNELDHVIYQNNLNKPLDVLADAASRVWLAANRPNYQDTVRVIHGELKQEVEARRDDILVIEGLSADVD